MRTRKDERGAEVDIKVNLVTTSPKKKHERCTINLFNTERMLINGKAAPKVIGMLFPQIDKIIEEARIMISTNDKKIVISLDKENKRTNSSFVKIQI